MKTPDKIYVHISPCLGLLEATEHKVNAPGEEEYIRKDALLDWLKAVKADVMIPMNIDRVIEKIESL